MNNSLSLSKAGSDLGAFLFLFPLYTPVDINLKPNSIQTVENVGDYEFGEWVEVTRFSVSDDFKFYRLLITGTINSVYLYCPGCEKEVFIAPESRPVAKLKKYNTEGIITEKINSDEDYHMTMSFASDEVRERFNELNDDFLEPSDTFSVGFKCMSPLAHKISITFRVDRRKEKIMKIGQYPSIADFDNTLGIYSKVLNKVDIKEFKKAINLKSHGNGIGSFVYLRRIFERLIDKKIKEEFSHDADICKKNLKLSNKKKIQLMKHKLPDFVVNNTFIYNILSEAVHKLEEEKCREYFETVMQALVMILKEDLRLFNEKRIDKELSVTLNNIFQSFEK